MTKAGRIKALEGIILKHDDLDLEKISPFIKISIEELAERIDSSYSVDENMANWVIWKEDEEMSLEYRKSCASALSQSTDVLKVEEVKNG